MSLLVACSLLSAMQSVPVAEEPPAPASVRLLDVTADGLLDELTFGADGSVAVAINVGRQSFLPIHQALPAVSVTDVLVSDLNGDRQPDLYLVSPRDNVALLGDGAGRFREATARLGLVDAGIGKSAERLDVDGDGLDDLLLHDVGGDVLFWAEAHGRFRRDTPAPAGSALDAALADADAETLTVLLTALLNDWGGAGSQASSDADDGAPHGPGSAGTPGGATGPAGSAPAPGTSQAGAGTSGPLPLLPDGTLASDRRANGARGTPGVDGPAPTPTIPPFLATILDAKYVNDNENEVDSADVVDGSLTGADISTSSGDVHFSDRLGVGTTVPQTTLHVDGSTDSSPTNHGLVVLGPVDSQNLTMDRNEILARDNGAVSTLNLNRDGGDVLLAELGLGFVGIGTNAPASMLDVDGWVNVREGLDVDGQVIVSGGANRPALSVEGSGFFGEDTGPLNASYGKGLRAFMSSTTGIGHLFGYDYLNSLALDLQLQKPGGHVIVGAPASSTYLGIGTEAPVTKLHVDGTADAGLTTHGLAVFGPTTSINLAFDQNEIMARDDGSGSDLYLNKNAGDVILAGDGQGKVGIGTTTPATTLDVDGAITIRGGADIVESFESSCGVLEPGTVVAIDPHNPGQLMCSAAAYDTKVAGVVSGAGGVNPGLLLGQDDMFSGDTKVAMTGRVYVKCTTEGGPVRPGDRLTTSSLAGHAMRVVDGPRADGAVIGKAMSALDDGTGLVLVLVNLQ